MDRVKFEFLGFEIDGVPSPCYIWQGPDSGKGRGGKYGRMYLDGQTVAVHIVVYTHFFGYIPGKMQIDHQCKNRLCCNPDHLQMITHNENQELRDIRNHGKKENHLLSGKNASNGLSLA